VGQFTEIGKRGEKAFGKVKDQRSKNVEKKGGVKSCTGMGKGGVGRLCREIQYTLAWGTATDKKGGAKSSTHRVETGSSMQRPRRGETGGCRQSKEWGYEKAKVKAKKKKQVRGGGGWRKDFFERWGGGGKKSKGKKSCLSSLNKKNGVWRNISTFSCNKNRRKRKSQDIEKAKWGTRGGGKTLGPLWSVSHKKTGARCR